MTNHDKLYNMKDGPNDSIWTNTRHLKNGLQEQKQIHFNYYKDIPEKLMENSKLHFDGYKHTFCILTDEYNENDEGELDYLGTSEYSADEGDYWQTPKLQKFIKKFKQQVEVQLIKNKTIVDSVWFEDKSLTQVKPNEKK